MIKPNEDELKTLAQKKLVGDQEIKKVAEKLHQQGCNNVVVSLGKKGVLWLNQSGWMQSILPIIDVICTVGAGDSLVAGLCWAELKQWNKEESLRFATA